jgi:hypothetical protein
MGEAVEVFVGAAAPRFRTYVKRLAQTLGHANRQWPLHGYLSGLVLPGGRKRVEPMAALLAPERVCQTHQRCITWWRIPPGTVARSLRRPGIRSARARTAVRTGGTEHGYGIVSGQYATVLPSRSRPWAADKNRSESALNQQTANISWVDFLCRVQFGKVFLQQIKT